MFNQQGYFKEYYINNKFIGMHNCDKDRKICGFFGQLKEITKENITFSNKKTIKKGSKVLTILYPFCGTVKKN